MGEMIKFGIKLAMIIAVAVGLTAAILILFNVLGDVLFTFNPSAGVHQYLYDIFRIISLVFPVNLALVFTTITSLFSFKIAYWASDKLIPLIDAVG